MTLPTSGLISIDMIAAEFGSSNKSLFAYYRGAGIVPNTAANANVPTSGQIGYYSFYGASGALTITPADSTKSTFRGNSLSENFTASGGSGTGYTWSWASGGTNISLSTTAGSSTLASSSTTNGTATLTRSGTLRVTDSLGATATATITWTFEGTA